MCYVTNLDHKSYTCKLVCPKTCSNTTFTWLEHARTSTKSRHIIGAQNRVLLLTQCYRLSVQRTHYRYKSYRATCFVTNLDPETDACTSTRPETCRNITFTWLNYTKVGAWSRVFEPCNGYVTARFRACWRARIRFRVHFSDITCRTIGFVLLMYLLYG